MSDINTSGGANPKPGTLINVGPRGRYSDYVLIGNYRIKQVRDGWQLFTATGDGWGKPRKFRSKTLAVAAMVEHMTMGTISSKPATFIVRRGYVVDEDSESPTHVDALLWRPKASGYVSEYNPWQAGLYTPADKDYRPRGEDPDAHSYTVPVPGYLVGAIQDDTPLAVLIDEIIRLRALVDASARGES